MTWTKNDRRRVAAIAALAAAVLLAGATVRADDASRLAEFLARSPAYAALPARSHTPEFSIAPVDEPAYAPEYSWIFDGRQKIGILNTNTKEIEMLRFAPPPDGAVIDYAMPAVHHWATLQGPRITLNAPLWLPVESSRLTRPKDRGPTLELVHEERLRLGPSGSSRFTLTWDARLGYVWNVDTHYTMAAPIEFEFNNLLAGGISESRDERKRWQKTIWSRPDGSVGCLFHNPLSPSLPNTPEWRDVPPGGFVGFVTEPDINPFVEILAVAPAMHMATCSQWYDQHLLAYPAKEKEADGLYHVRARYRFLSLPGPVARELEKTATAVIPAYNGSAYGFLFGRVNGFETPIPPNTVYNGGLWNAAIVEGAAHTGARSLQMAGSGPGRTNSASPIAGGSAIYGESARRYRLSAWVKTEGLTNGAAWLQCDDVFWNWNDIRATRSTGKLTGKKDWTELSVEFQPVKGDPFLNVKLCVEGTGTAWFDDLLLTGIDEKRKE